MSPAVKQAENRRTTARVALSIFVAFSLAFVLLSGGPIGAISFAQQATTTPPATPPCNGAQIEWLNPSGTATTGPGPEASNKAETTPAAGTATNGYHLVAWISGNPDTPRVEFTWQGSGNEQTITSNATKVGTDTFEFYFDLNGVQETTGNMNDPGIDTIPFRAKLFAGASGIQCDSDEQEVEVNNQDHQAPQNADPRNEPQGETVEILYPANGQQVGFYKGAATLDVKHSAGVTFIYAWYTLSPPGTEPTWKACNTDGEAAADAATGVKCTLAAGDTPSQVRAVGVTANDANTSLPTAARPQSNDSGDAHRSNGYEQVPTNITDITMTPNDPQVQPNASGNFPCSPVISFRVTDQLNRKVVGANVDVHAAGPSDNLYFDDSGNNSSAHQAPNSAHAKTELTADCESSTQDPPPEASGTSQAEHETAGNDIKHIESQAAGTAEDGTFKFQLATRAKNTGTTDILMVADVDDNDQVCAGSEPVATTAIGWGVAPQPGPAPVGEGTACPTVTPTSTTSSPSPSQSTTSTSPTPTSSNTSTATSSPSPSNTTTEPPPGECSDGVDNDGDGDIDGNDGGCADGDNDESTGDEPDREVRNTTVTGRYDDSQNRHEGRIKAKPRKCKVGRVTIVKQVQPGADDVVGRDKTNSDGEFTVRDPNADGTFYSVAKRKAFTNANGVRIICKKDRSPNYDA